MKLKTIKKKLKVLSSLLKCLDYNEENNSLILNLDEKNLFIKTKGHVAFFTGGHLVLDADKTIQLNPGLSEEFKKLSSEKGDVKKLTHEVKRLNEEARKLNVRKSSEEIPHFDKCSSKTE